MKTFEEFLTEAKNTSYYPDEIWDKMQLLLKQDGIKYKNNGKNWQGSWRIEFPSKTAFDDAREIESHNFFNGSHI